MSKIGRLYIILLMVYYCSSVLLGGGKHDMNNLSDNMIPKLSAGIFIIYNIWLFFYYKNIRLIGALKRFGSFTLFTLISFLFFYLTTYREMFYFTMYLKVLMWLLSLMVLYKHFTVCSSEEVKKLSTYFCVVFILGGLFEYVNELITLGGAEYGSGSCMYVILPLVFLIFRSSKYLPYFILAVFIISAASLMRKPLIICGVIILMMHKELRKSLNFWTIIIIATVFISFLSMYIDSLIGTILERMAGEREEGVYGSGRTIFWALILDDFFNGCDIMRQFVGNGYGSVIQLTQKKYGMPIGAHNGFIDCLYSYGYIGLMLYASIFYGLLSKIKILKKINAYHAKILFVTVVMWFIQNCVYFGFDGPYMIAYSFIFAIVFSDYKKKDYQMKMNLH